VTSRSSEVGFPGRAISAFTLSALCDILCKRLRNTLTYIDQWLGRLPDPSWRRCPGHPGNRWLDQLCRDNSTPPADLWRWAVTHGHSGVTLRSLMTMC